MFPPVRLPHIFLQPSGLRQPGPTLYKQVTAGLSLSSPAPSALIIHRPVDLVLQVWAYCRVTGQELVIPAGN